MVYIMNIYADGGCRGNGAEGAIGAAAVIFKLRYGRYKYSATKSLAASPRPTNQRAEIEAIILALQKVLERYEALNGDPLLKVTVYSDSQYAVSCMTEWIPKWIDNGWVNSAGRAVVNQDLLKKAWNLDARLRQEGKLMYRWIPREKNEVADELCNEEMNKQMRR
jgi:ribonuclease HI